MAYFSCTIDSVVTPAISVRLSEGYNEGWTATAYFPAASVYATSAVNMRVNDGTRTMILTMEPEELAEDSYGVEVSFRDKATRRLAHSKYDGSTLHCISADNALSQICTASGSSKSGSTGFGNIHYAATDEQNSLSLVTDLLDTCAAHYNTNGQVVNIQAVHTTADHTLASIVTSNRLTNHEGLISRVILNKVTPCDITTSFCEVENYELDENSSTSYHIIPNNIEFTEEIRIACVRTTQSWLDWERSGAGGTIRLAVTTHSVVENISSYQYGGSGECCSCQLIGVTTSNCPADYAPSFIAYYDNPTGNLIKYANRTSTVWATQAQATARASYYLWLENKDYKTATIMLPLNLSIRAGDVVAYQSSNYRVTAVTHSFTTAEATTEVEASAI